MSVEQTLIAIDPGLVQSAWLAYRRDPFSVWSIAGFGLDPNEQLLERMRRGLLGVDQVVLEQIESFGMAVGRDVFETVRWAGRFEEALHPIPVAQLSRRSVKTHLCGSMKAKDPNVRQALIDRFGGDTVAIGRKAAPGPLHGISKDVWSALAIAVTYADTEVRP